MTIAAYKNQNISGAKSDWNNQYQPGMPSEIGSSRDDKISLLLKQERRLSQLEELNQKLVSERDMLKRNCQSMTKIIKSLESRCTVSEQPQIPLNELPKIDAAEFLPLVDTPAKETAIQRLVRVSGDLVKGAAAGK